MTDIDSFTEENDFEKENFWKRIKDPEVRYHLLLDWSVMCMNMLAWFGLYQFIYLYNHEGQPGGILMAAVILIYYSIIYGVRCKRKSLWLLLFIHILLYIPVLFYGVRGQGEIEIPVGFLLVMLSVCLIASIQYHRQGERYYDYENKWHLVLEVLILYFWGVFCHQEGFRMAGLFLALAFLLLHLWCSYLKRFLAFLDENGTISKVTVTSIFNQSKKVIMGLLTIVCFLILLSMFLQADDVFQFFKDSFLRLIQKIAEGIQNFFRWIHSFRNPSLEKTVAEEATEQIQQPQEYSEAGDNLFLVIMGGLVFLSFLVWGIRENFLEWQQARQNKQKPSAKKLLIPDRVTVIQESEEKPWEKLVKKIFRSNQEKVRYLFKKRVRKSLQKNIRQTETANALKRRVKEKGTDIHALTELYQVARYGDREIEAEEIRKVKKND